MLFSVVSSRLENERYILWGVIVVVGPNFSAVILANWKIGLCLEAATLSLTVGPYCALWCAPCVPMSMPFGVPLLGCLTALLWGFHRVTLFVHTRTKLQFRFLSSCVIHGAPLSDHGINLFIVKDLVWRALGAESLPVPTH